MQSQCLAFDKQLLPLIPLKMAHISTLTLPQGSNCQFLENELDSRIDPQYYC